jgi:E3 ubiquitin-protein ligase XBAT32/33
VRVSFPPSVVSGMGLSYIVKPSDGGVTTLHMAAFNGHFNCMQLLIDLGANVSAVTFP